MATQRISSKFFCQVEKVRKRIAEGGLAFSDCVSPEIVCNTLEELGLAFRESIFTPWMTLWAFLTQSLSADGSCRSTVDQVIAHLVARGKRPCAPATSTYCEARSRLPQAFYASLVHETGRKALEQTPQAWQFHGRPVKVVDGSSVSLADTQENRAEYPLQDPKRQGISFPIARLLVIFSLAVGTVLEHAIAPYRGKGTGELSMFRRLLDTFEPGDIVLGDRGFCSYGHAASLARRSVDLVIKLNISRLPNLTLVKRLGRRDALYRWRKPRGKPESFSAQEFAELPDELEVRMIRVRVSQPGSRTRAFWVLTTLCDAKLFSGEEIAKLYRRRWLCELYLRDIKTTLGMGVLRCETPEMARKELLTYLLAYNLIRIQMAQAGEAVGIAPHRISFKGTVQALRAFRSSGMRLSEEHRAILLALIAYHEVGKQPGRHEPRKIKRRPSFEYLTEPRADARKRLLKTA